MLGLGLLLQMSLLVPAWTCCCILPVPLRCGCCILLVWLLHLLLLFTVHVLLLLCVQLPVAAVVACAHAAAFVVAI